MLRRETGRADLVLADYFDYIAGNSTGAIIAAGLCLGMDTCSLRRFYRAYGPAIFSRANLWQRLTRHKYHSEVLSKTLRDLLGAETQLGSSKLRTLLMMVMRNITTDARWLVTNHPGAKYNDPRLPECNLRLPLWQLVRASAAAPVYFDPQAIAFEEKAFEFVDGAVCSQNNPAFQLFLMATLEPYRLCWPAGEQRMLLVSVGTGQAPVAPARNLPTLLDTARRLPTTLMAAALQEQDALCRIFGRCFVGEPLDGELQDLHNVQSPAGHKLFTYLRYDMRIDAAALSELGIDGVSPHDLGRLDAIGHIEDLERIGQRVGQKVSPTHYRHFLPTRPGRRPRGLRLSQGSISLGS